MDNRVMDIKKLQNFNVYADPLINNDFSRYNSRSFSNTDLDYLTKKSELTELELNCTNKFLNISQFDQGINVNANKPGKIFMQNNKTIGMYLLNFIYSFINI